MAYFIYVALATSFLMGALLFVHQGQQKAKEEAVSQRLASAGLQTLQVERRRDWLTSLLERAGIEIDATRRRIIGLALILLMLLATYQVGPRFALLLALALAVVAYSILAGLAVRRKNQIVAQLPRLLDQVVRLMRTGKTIGDSFSLATKDADDPLKSVMQRLERNITMGMSIPEAFKDMGDTYALKELQVMALGVGVNARFGGSLVDLLNNIIQLIQQREKMVRQLRAMTGETRISALVLSVLPLLMGAFMFLRSPDYLMTLINDPGGRSILVGAGVMQILGMFVIWKMLRSI